MYIIKNSLINIIRNKGRNILIGIIVIVISAAVAITLSIRNSATKIVTAYEEKNQLEATIEMNREDLMQSFKEESSSQEDMIDQFNNIESVTVEEIDNYGDSEYVSSYYYEYDLGVDADDLEEATDSLVKETTTTETKTDTTTRSFGGGPQMPGGGSQTQRNSTTTTKKTEKIFNEKAQNGAFTLKGYSSYESMTDFITGNYTISEGEVGSDFTSNNCIVSEELATLNELEVGDTITIVNPNNSKKTYELTITGIYTENSDNSKSMNNMFTSSANNIITNSSVVEEILADDEDLEATVTPTFILTSKDVIEKFSEEVKEKGLSEYYEVSTNLEEVESATKSISSVKTFATTFLIITLIIGGVVLLVINMINIRERKYEIGVLRTIGMKKILVISQFMIELLVVSFFALLVGAGIGSLCSVKVANSLLASEIENASSDFDKINENFGGGMMNPSGGDRPSSEEKTTEDEKSEVETSDDSDNKSKSREDFNFNGLVTINEVDSINAVVDFKVLIELLLIGLGLTIFSSISACVSISRFSPLNILKERS